ncbi:MAG: hypothetical protein HRT89_12390 [Lentisphaeria bacterium]|nr:hypothetical protein [Lentisphaeria bacterium]NQZ68856.1 hypothetical protein [Lentisphaeria bacterium]
MSEFGTDSLFSARDRAQEICSILMSNGYAPVNEFRDLLYDELLRNEVERRLDRIGMKLLHNIYSDHWGVALNANTASDDRLEWSNNLGLDRGAMALMLILWCKLILPKRLDQESKKDEPGHLGQTFKKEMDEKPVQRASISRDQITSEFGAVLGGVTNTSKYLSQLARTKIIKVHSGVIEEGPLLALVIDEQNLSDELRRDVMISVLNRQKTMMKDNVESSSDEAEDEDEEVEEDV